MSDFDLNKFLNERPHILSSTRREDFHSSLNRPRALEGLGLCPTMLGQGDCKNYLAWHSRIRMNYRISFPISDGPRLPSF